MTHDNPEVLGEWTIKVSLSRGGRDQKQRWKRRGVSPIRHYGWFIYTVILCLLIGFIVAPKAWFHHVPSMSFAQSLTRELLRGHLIGSHQGPPLYADVQLAQPGDVILCHNPDGAFGYWTHAVLYIGKGQVIDANNFAHGTARFRVENYRDYDEVMVLRPKTDQTVRQKAAQSAMNAVGTPYDPLASIADKRTLYCSKLIWRAYAAAGYKLCPERSWVLPDDIASSPNLFCVERWSTSKRERHETNVVPKKSVEKLRVSVCIIVCMPRLSHRTTLARPWVDHLYRACLV